MSAQDDLIPLAKLPIVLREIMKERAEITPGYRALYNRVLDGEIPAQQKNGRWYVTRGTAEVFAGRLSDAHSTSHGAR
jgi:hypothetical protein